MHTFNLSLKSRDLVTRTAHTDADASKALKLYAVRALILAQHTHTHTHPNRGL